MDSNHEHQQINNILEEIKALNDVQQKNFNDEIEKNEMQTSTALRLAADQKRENEELKIKISQLQAQLKIKEKLELEILKLKEKLNSRSHKEDEFFKFLCRCLRIKKLQKGQNKPKKWKISVYHWLGFQLAMDQIRVLNPGMDLSEFGVFKVIEDGKLVDMKDDEIEILGF